MQRKTLMLDEATSALDPELVGEVLDVVRELASGGLTMVIVTHHMHFASQVADRVVFMDNGRVVETNTAKDFFRNPQTERSKAFLQRVAIGGE
jgi:ABC-type polar amino acid transport system ATPase subunit